ncbi:hypothetical protein AMJ49_02040 [Parcubacteria bacterium DG_74_2]|nr:MAG: hypothetical protein AMJ49_02040 [Parcubacteria bacterium DG_74_2]
MNQFYFLTAKLPAQIGLTIFLILSVLFLGFFSWNFDKTEREIIFSEAYYPMIGKRKIVEAIEDPFKEVIKIEAEEEILYYQKQSFWDEEDFLKILNLREEFSKMEIGSFEKNILEEGKKEIEIKNSEFEFNKEEKSTVFTCQIRGTMEDNDSFDFHWLLKNFPFNFFKFKKFDKELIFDGKINGISTEISLKFPFSIANSKERVWQK